MKKQYIMHSLRRSALALAGPLLVLSMFGGAHPASAASVYGSCTDVTLLVAMAVGQAADQTVSGELCTPNTWASGTHDVDVTTPGATYNKNYFDWPGSTTYSYAEKTLQAGRAIFNYDRIGSGNSSHPLGTTITVQSDAYVLHEIIQWLRTSHGYTQVTSIGHSYGSSITVVEAGTYNDENRVVNTGFLHAPDPGLVLLSDFLYPALLDPRTGAKLDTGYLTTVPNSRSIFYSAPTADPTVVAYDNAHPDLVSNTAFATAAATLLATPPGLNISDKITSPMLLVDGEDDNFFCGPLEIVNCADHALVTSYEAPYYTSAASLDFDSVPNTGHALATSTSADQSFAMINNWIKAH